MYEYILSGEYDCAATRRVSRKGEPKLKSFFSRMFYKIINRISDTEIIDGAQDYRFMTRQMVNSILEMKEYNRFSKGIFSWVGFRTKYIEVENVERAAGTTTWSFKKLFLYSLEGIFEFSTAMLNMPMYIGLLFGVITIAELVIYFVKPDFIGNDASMKILITGIACLIFICMGINNQYFSKMYLEVKARPKYLIRETEESYKAKNR